MRNKYIGYIYIYNPVERWCGNRDEIKKGRGVTGWSEKSLRLSLRAAPCVSLVPRFERLVETSRLWSDVSRIYFRVFRRRSDHLSFFTPVADHDTTSYDDGGRKRFENVCHGTSPGNCPILGWICNARRPRWTMERSVNARRSETSDRSSIMTDLSWIFIHRVVTAMDFYSLANFSSSFLYLVARIF